MGNVTFTDNEARGGVGGAGGGNSGPDSDGSGGGGGMGGDGGRAQLLSDSAAAGNGGGGGMGGNGGSASASGGGGGGGLGVLANGGSGVASGSGGGGRGNGDAGNPNSGNTGGTGVGGGGGGGSSAGGGGSVAFGGAGGTKVSSDGNGGAGGGGGAGLGGAVFIDGGTVSMTNATISENRAVGGAGGSSSVGGPAAQGGAGGRRGGGIFNYGGTLSLTHATVASNTADQGGALTAISDGPSMTHTFVASILADSTIPTNLDCESGGLGDATFTMVETIIETQDGCEGPDLVPYDDDPGLQPLALNAPGTSMTHALLPGSFATDGVQGTCTTPLDQRGVPRPRNGNVDPAIRCDIGAYELAGASGTIQFGAPPYTVAEAAGNAVIQITRTGGDLGPVSATLTLTNGTATAPGDYTGTPIQVSFAAGITSVNVPVPIANDALDEVDETVGLSLTSPSFGATIGTPGTATLTILDDDVPGFSIDDVTQAEGTGGTTSFIFTVSLTQPNAQPATVNVATADGTALAGSDYTAIPTLPVTTLTFPPNTPSQTATVTVAADSTVESAENFAVNLSGATGATIADAQGVGTMVDDDGAPTVSISDATTTEGDTGTTTLTFTVTLSQASSTLVTVPYTLGNQTATGGAACAAGVDFVNTGGTVTFQPLDVSETIVLTVCADAVVEGDETLAVNLGAPTGGATVADGLGIGTIVDDDGAPSISIGDASVSEGDAGTASLVFTVTQSRASGTLVTVPYTLANQTATGGAACAAGVDFVNTGGTVTFQPGDTSETIAVTVCADALVEANETLVVTLGAPTGGATVADGQGIGTIVDDDGAGVVSFSTGSAQVPESAGSVTLTVVRSGGAGPSATGTTTPGASIASGSVRPNPPGSPVSGQPAPGAGTVAPSALGVVTVNFASANVEAEAGLDYGASAGTLTFGVNETTKTIVIPILADSLQEGPEHFTVVLSNPTGGAALGPPTVAIVTIIDTTHGAATPPGDDSADDEREERERETEEERRQRARTNQGNKDDDSIEGDVVETRCDLAWPSVVIANRDGLVEVKLLKEAQAACSSIKMGDYLEADGEKQHEQLFHADSVEIKRRR